jgi:hypothetical protein
VGGCSVSATTGDEAARGGQNRHEVGCSRPRGDQTNTGPPRDTRAAIGGMDGRLVTPHQDEANGTVT